jgi:membrane protease YdiL (CAAX protease family)
MLGLAAGFAVLSVLPVPGILGVWVRAVLFVAIPLATYAWAVPGHWRVIFPRPRAEDGGWAVAFALLGIFVLLALGTLLAQRADFNPNPLGAELIRMTPVERVLTFLALVPQLLGEELLTVLPFLALLAWLRRRLPLAVAVVLAALGAVLLFSAAHLPTYDWNLVQCFVVVGAGRVVLLAGYLTTRSVWVSAAAHLLTDWALLGLILLVG